MYTQTCLTCGGETYIDGPWNTTVVYCTDCVLNDRHLTATN